MTSGEKGLAHYYFWSVKRVERGPREDLSENEREGLVKKQKR